MSKLSADIQRNIRYNLGHGQGYIKNTFALSQMQNVTYRDYDLVVFCFDNATLYNNYDTSVYNICHGCVVNQHFPTRYSVAHTHIIAVTYITSNGKRVPQKNLWLYPDDNIRIVYNITLACKTRKVQRLWRSYKRKKIALECIFVWLLRPGNLLALVYAKRFYRSAQQVQL